MTSALDAQVLLDELKIRPMHYGALVLTMGGDRWRTIEAIDVLLRSGLAVRELHQGITRYRTGPTCLTMSKKR